MDQPPYLRNAFGKRIILRVYDSCNGRKTWSAPPASVGGQAARQIIMKHRSLALLILCVLSVATYGQSVSRAKGRIVELTTDTSASDDRVFAAHAITALKRLEDNVIIYHSLGDFEAGGKLARVSFETFQNDLQTVTGEVESTLSLLSNDR